MCRPDYFYPTFIYFVDYGIALIVYILLVYKKKKIKFISCSLCESFINWNMQIMQMFVPKKVFILLQFCSIVSYVQFPLCLVLTFQTWLFTNQADECVDSTLSSRLWLYEYVKPKSKRSRMERGKWFCEKFGVVLILKYKIYTNFRWHSINVYELQLTTMR